MPDYDYKEVYFHEYCKTCKHAGLILRWIIGGYEVQQVV